MVYEKYRWVLLGSILRSDHKECDFHHRSWFKGGTRPYSLTVIFCSIVSNLIAFNPSFSKTQSIFFLFAPFILWFLVTFLIDFCSSLSRNKKINWKPSSGGSQENKMFEILIFEQFVQVSGL